MNTIVEEMSLPFITGLSYGNQEILLQERARRKLAELNRWEESYYLDLGDLWVFHCEDREDIRYSPGISYVYQTAYYKPITHIET